MEDAGVLRGQWRAGMSGATGLDMPAALRLLGSRGHDEDIAALFLPWWEDGALDAFAEMRKARE